MLEPMRSSFMSPCLSNQRPLLWREANAPSPLLAVIPAILVLVAGCATQPPPVPDARSADPGALPLQILDPRDETSSTSRSFVNILGRTSPHARVTVEGKDAPVFSTGIFVRDQVPLQPGENQFRIVAFTRDGKRAERVITVKRISEPVSPTPPPGKRLEIDPNSIQPARDLILGRGDVLEVSFRGTAGQTAEFRLANSDWRPMAEVASSGSTGAVGLYRASWVAAPEADAPAEPVRFRLRRPGINTNSILSAAETVVEAASRAKVGFWDEASLRLVRTREDGAALSFGLHEVRLGGPYRAELPAETVLRVTGMQGGSYRVRLCPGVDGWVSSRDVEWAPAGTPLPHLAFTSLSVYGDAGSDHVVIPCSAPVPFAVTPGTSPAGRATIEIDFFGAHHAATWISHRATARSVREVTVSQPGTDHVRVTLELQGSQLWGYQWSVTNQSLRVAVRRPPTLARPPASPLKGLTIALEAGHGGANPGARGVSGSLEKDINRLAVEELARQFRAAGALPVMVRQNDEEPSLAERARRAIASNAALFISVHANSAGHESGYLRVSGTSTYYKWPFSRDFAAAIHRRLLRHTQLDDFGNVGNFNYAPIRLNTWMPAMLVEQAFMSNPADEAKMLDPRFRKEMMRAVVLGTQDWLECVRTRGP